MTIREELLQIGMKENEMDFHCSDLYVLKNNISSKWLESYEFKGNVTTFIDEIDNKVWYEIPFAYEEYFENRFDVIDFKKEDQK